MFRSAVRLAIAALVAATAMGNERSPPPAQQNPGGFQVWRGVSSMDSMTSSNANKTISFVPAIVVDDPSTTGKRRKQNACDRCSLCLGKVGSTGNSRDTLQSIYQEGVYQYESRNRSLDKCLSNRHCQDCDAQVVTYTLPSTTFTEGEIKRVLTDVTFPSQSYLLDIQYDIVS